MTSWQLFIFDGLRSLFEARWKWYEEESLKDAYEVLWTYVTFTCRDETHVEISSTCRKGQHVKNTSTCDIDMSSYDDRDMLEVDTQAPASERVSV